jgi:hypothetical protein
MKLEERKAALLKLVEEYREQECRRILDAAREEAGRLVAETYRKERAHLHVRIVSERSRAQARIQAARAELATRERWSRERTSISLLDSAWPRLRDRLAARWGGPAGRRAWVKRYLGEALALLPRGPWRVRHAAGWGESERRDVVAWLRGELDASPGLQVDDAMEAGLVVEYEGALLDASLDGLTKDRSRLEARLLALLTQAREASASD